LRGRLETRRSPGGLGQERLGVTTATRSRNGAIGRPDGFTLVEMLTGIAVLGILTTIAMGKIDVARYQVNATLQMLGTTMVAAQREAITKQHDMILTFDAANRVLRLAWDANSNAVIDGGERTRVIELDDRVVFGRGGAPARAIGGNPINFNRVIDGLPALIFHRNGSASGIGGFYLTTTRAAGSGSSAHANDTRAVEIVRATGRTEWYRYTGSSWARGF
jgi:prepilin-type N-terminal cleavage/methylation domain-containing protein